MPLKKCKGCGDRYEKQADHPPFRNWCGIECALSIARTAQDKARAKKQAKAIREHRDKHKAARKEVKKRKEALKTKGQWTKEAQTAFNKFIRARDHGKPCISCGALNPIGWDAGHFMTVGGHPELRFTEINCHRQCGSCNRGGEKYFRKAPTVAKQYERQLRERIGNEKVDWLKGSHEPLHLSIDDIKAIKSKYNKLARELEKDLV